ncbi:hypothetical protein CEXT_102361 [Caerostris extrusa]|uniref:Uncharacterized protein n=1 Tax=Caerostris extrusa TaxID=172846 RepID=A0AAV4N6V8_CAEEX|nr:hypothetical protein CEXT_102361 [Caerostris extrusa]
MNAVRIQYGKDKRFITGEDTSSGGCPPVGEQLRLLTTGFVRSVSLETPSARQHLIREKYLQNYPYTRSLIKPRTHQDIGIINFLFPISVPIYIYRIIYISIESVNIYNGA